MSKSKLTVVVGSKNPVKVNAAQVSIQRLYPDHDVVCEGIDAPSLVADQPMTDAETRLGAVNRVEYCQTNHDADFYVAIEGGVDNFVDGPATFAYIVIAHRGLQSVGRTAQLPLPNMIYQALVAGEELGHVMDRLFNTDNIKQKGGAIALLTQHQASRGSIYEQGCLLAMAPFINAPLYQG
ncbi:MULTISPECIES: inosine/xanthosine triphosphatase [Motilimonas]|uniref:Inosine/xanthosine triphosphatase n=1 Tax=Motilimonas cestriensis TaxID=2742685 RepID=A0ABS8W8X6_9GAMM|nr:MULTISPECIES: inosine/xanthosine triphosphatase [Motilimonas]MCE0555366.1 inosine/xanthosine triphosphatase [Motilimonas sp. E26]MCE2594812.1 inosine/xanthosine triphosphatase [Motilimonas cestriensis]